ncbi:MAG: hypothetical protein JG776_1717 [Caloramator sp.]|jgi:hypothetical protein|uniref:hypothetical protein n=1 Tax=Caloramator sp. TaxID=1871330 RepID=UPI001D2F927A|nr:hypothetical protein [Caloramator sp.]MBZ4664002.1 hypothetical protein [Caloramator sp.]
MGDLDRAVGILENIMFNPFKEVGGGYNFSLQEFSLGFELVKTLRDLLLRDRELKSELVKVYVEVINIKEYKILDDLIDYVKQNYEVVVLTRQNKYSILEQFIKNNGSRITYCI